MLIKVLLVDDQPVVIAGLHVALDNARGIIIVGEVDDAAGAVRMTLRLRPDVVILDPAVDSKRGLHAIGEIHRLRPATRVIVFSQYSDFDSARQVIKLGAAGFLPKTHGTGDLQAAVRLVVRGRTYLPASLVDAAVACIANPTPSRSQSQILTERESKVLELLALELTSKEISDALGISPRTVGTHRANIMRKLNTHSVAGLVRYAIESGLVKAKVAPQPDPKLDSQQRFKEQDDPIGRAHR